eukprot:maker-scaffold72_size415059-snap-gene-2.21 protein:Tk08669 transcript:maker-scaffold72_size415059-snap-gene-2.21-mRNA-1 annotation:"PREDICTED: hypothetical protein LOC100646249"
MASPLLLVVALLLASLEAVPAMSNNDPRRPVFDRVFEPVLGEVGTLRFVEEQVHTIGAKLNQGIDFLHDTDHGTRICNQDQPFNHGVCFTSGKCRALGGMDVGFCAAITPKNTCCKFPRTCGQESIETVTYVKSDPFSTQEDCEVTIEARLGACQLRVDFLEFDLPKPHQSGICMPNSSLEIIQPGLKPFIFGQGNSYFCGTNSGNHFYLPITKHHELIRFKFRNTGAKQPYHYHLRISQVDCRSGLAEMRALRAPDGCTQWFVQPRGGLASYNYDGKSPIAPAQTYSACFNSTPCALALQTEDFRLGTDVSCNNHDQSCTCQRAYLGTSLPEDLDAKLLPNDRFCGFGLGLERGLLVTRTGPFVLRVHVDVNDVSPPHDAGFLFVYNLIDSC